MRIGLRKAVVARSKEMAGPRYWLHLNNIVMITMTIKVMLINIWLIFHWGQVGTNPWDEVRCSERVCQQYTRGVLVRWRFLDESSPKLERPLIVYLPLGEVLHRIIQLRHIRHRCRRFSPVLVLQEKCVEYLNTKQKNGSFFIGPRSDHSLPMSVTDWLTD